MAEKEVYIAVLEAQESRLQEFTADLQSESGRKNCFRIARQMAREGRDVISVCCMKNDAGNVVSDADGMKNIWMTYMEKLYMLRMTGMVKWIVLRRWGPVFSFRNKRLQQLLIQSSPVGDERLSVYQLFQKQHDLWK